MGGGGGGGGGSDSAAALGGGGVSSVDVVNGDDDDGKRRRRRINFESGIASMPSPNWYSSTHLTVGLVRDFGALLPHNYHHHHREEVSSSSKTRGGGKGVMNVIAYCAKNNVVLLDGETNQVYW